MKITAYILIISLVMLGLNRFIEVMNYSEPRIESSCSNDRCHSDTERCRSDTDSDQEEENGEEEHSCPPGCDCYCCLHIVAVEYQFLTISVLTNQTIHYAAYNDHYWFDYNSLVFQPPRLG